MFGVSLANAKGGPLMIFNMTALRLYETKGMGFADANARRIEIAFLRFVTAGNSHAGEESASGTSRFWNCPRSLAR